MTLQAGWACFRSGKVARQRTFRRRKVANRPRPGAEPEATGLPKLHALVDLAWVTLRQTPAHIQRSTRYRRVSEREEPRLASDCLYGKRHKYCELTGLSCLLPPSPLHKGKKWSTCSLTGALCVLPLTLPRRTATKPQVDAVTLSTSTAVLEPRPALCQRCGSQLLGSNPVRRYCSDYCRRASWIDRSRRRIIELRRAWRQRAENRRKESEWARRWYVTNRPRALETSRQWSRRNRDRKNHHERARRGLIKGGAGTWSLSEWRSLLDRYGLACAYCARPGPLTADHRVPLSRGGSNEIANLLPACKSCNSRKGTRTEAEFRSILDAERKELKQDRDSSPMEGKRRSSNSSER